MSEQKYIDCEVYAKKLASGVCKRYVFQYFEEQHLLGDAVNIPGFDHVEYACGLKTDTPCGSFFGERIPHKVRFRVPVEKQETPRCEDCCNSIENMEGEPYCKKFFGESFALIHLLTCDKARKAEYYCGESGKCFRKKEEK